MILYNIFVMSYSSASSGRGGGGGGSSFHEDESPLSSQISVLVNLLEKIRELETKYKDPENIIETDISNIKESDRQNLLICDQIIEELEEAKQYPYLEYLLQTTNGKSPRKITELDPEFIYRLIEKVDIKFNRLYLLAQKIEEYISYY